MFLITLPILIALAIYWNFSQIHKRDNNRASTKELLPLKFNQKKLIYDLSKIAVYEKKIHNNVFNGEKKSPVKVALPKAHQNDPKENLVFLKRILFTKIDNEQLGALENIKKDVSKNKDQYSTELQNQLEDALKKNDESAQSEVLAIASILPIGPSPLYEESQHIMQTFSEGSQKWNESLFKNALQLFLIQSIYRSEDSSRFKNELIQSAENEELKNKIERMFTDIEINNTEKVDQ